eukprot:g1734.t1
MPGTTLTCTALFMSAEKAAAEEEDAGKLSCEVCRKTFASLKSHEQHMLSKNHKQQVKKMAERQARQAAKAAASPPARKQTAAPVDETIRVSAAPIAAGNSGGEAAAAGAGAGGVEVGAGAGAGQDESKDDACCRPCSPSSAASSSSSSPSSSAPAGGVAVAAAVAGGPGGDGAGAGSGEIKPWDVTCCLFCSEKHATVEDNVSHMHKEHGFFIPDAEYLMDLEGLIGYLGLKISYGHVCLYCNGRGKSFDDLRSVQAHMRSKFHCKLLYDEDVDLDEYEDFYDFEQPDPLDPEAVAAHKAKLEAEAKAAADGSVLAVAAGQEGGEEMHVAPTTGELVLAGGRRVVGHRSLRAYYKQRYRPMDLRPAVLAEREARISRMIAYYGKAGVTTVSTFAEKRRRYNIAAVRKERSKKEHEYEKQKMQLGWKQNKLQGRFFRIQYAAVG